jgi:hypothetical protein
MEQERNLERNEVFERIPWETLEEKKPDRQWIMLAVAGAIVLGALAYTWTSSRAVPITVTTTPATVPTTVPAVAVAPPAAAVPPAQGTSSVPAPVVTAEADLYAVHPERAIDRAAAHAEWFVAEYLTVDGSEGSQETIAALLPVGVPLPVATEGTRVFVEWVRAMEVEEIGDLTYRVTVLARSLAAEASGDYVRQPPFGLEVDVSVTGDSAQVVTAPRVAPAMTGEARKLQFSEVPDEVGARAIEQSGGTDVVGGVQANDGSWEVIVMSPGPGGVARPVTVPIPPS